MSFYVHVIFLTFVSTTLAQFPYPPIPSGPYGQENTGPIFQPSLPPRPRDPTNYIQSGEAVEEFQPFVASLFTNGYHFCTGSLISSNKILSAAHCFGGNDKMRAILGLLQITAKTVKENEDNANVTIVDFTMKDVKIHPEYNGNLPVAERKGDMAIVTLPKPVKEIFKPISISSEYEGDATLGPLKAMGWGFQNCSWRASEFLREADGYYIDPWTCSRIDGVEVANSKVCTLLKTNDTMAAVAPGDSGGPLFSLFDSENPVQIGVASYVKLDPLQPVIPGKWMCVHKHQPQYYARVSSYKDFIKSNAPEAKFSP